MLIVVSGPSGVGKTTVARRLCALEGFVKATTATTRLPRPGEVEGRDYFFLSREQFEKDIQDGAFLEHATIFGNLYGTPKRSIETSAASGKPVVVDIDSQGARSIQAMALPAVFFFVAPPDLDELKKRLEGRQSESREGVERRLAAAEAESAQREMYDVVIVNRTVDQAVADIQAELRKRKIL